VNRFCSRNGKREGSVGKHLREKGEKAMQIKGADVAELVDARDLKSLDGNVVWVRVPPPAPGIAFKGVAAGPDKSRSIGAPDQANKRALAPGLFVGRVTRYRDNP
jgi:hypothetical protein